MDVITFFSILKKSSFLNYAKVNKINSSNFLSAVSNVFQQFIYSVLVNKKWSFKIFAIAIFIMPYIANSNSENNVITKYFANPVLDLNSVNAGVDHVVQFIPTTGNLSPMSVIPTLSSDTNSILSAVVSFSGEIDQQNFYTLQTVLFNLILIRQLLQMIFLLIQSQLEWFKILPHLQLLS